MGSLVDGLFGGSSKKAAAAQVASTEKAMATTQAATEQTRKDIFNYDKMAREQRIARLAQAQDVMRTMFAPMYQAQTQGNMNAQQMLAGSPMQMQNALLGQPVDYSGLQAKGLDVDVVSMLSGMQQLANLRQPRPEEPPNTTAVMYSPDELRAREFLGGSTGGSAMGSYGRMPAGLFDKRYMRV